MVFFGDVYIYCNWSEEEKNFFLNIISSCNLDCNFCRLKNAPNVVYLLFVICEKLIIPISILLSARYWILFLNNFFGIKLLVIVDLSHFNLREYSNRIDFFGNYTILSNSARIQCAAWSCAIAAVLEYVWRSGILFLKFVTVGKSFKLFLITERF